MGIKRAGLSFYALRHTFETVAGETKDQVAVDAIMGHVNGTMATHYLVLRCGSRHYSLDAFGLLRL